MFYLKNLIKNNIAFLVVPITIIILGLLVGKINSNYFLINWDPDYAYLFNGLSIYSGKAPQHIDHPGTTLQSAIAIYFFIREMGTSSQALYLKVIADPEKFLSEINLFILIFTSIINFFLGTVVCKILSSRFLGIVSQLMIFLSPGILLSLSRVNPDPLTYGISILIFLPALFAIRYSNKFLELSLKIAAFILGLGLATKLTMIPHLGVIYLYVKSRSDLKKLLTFLLFGIVIGTIVWILNWKNYYYILRWVKNLISGSSLYGGGNKFFIDIEQSVPKFYSLLAQELIFSCIFLFNLLFLIYIYFFNNANSYNKEIIRIIKTILIVQSFSLFIVLKHPLGEYAVIGEATRYLIPTISLMGIVLPLLLYSCLNRLKNKEHFYKITAIFSILIVFVMQIYFFEDLKNKRSSMFYSINARNEVLENNYSDCAKIHRDDSTVEFAIYHGLEWAGVKPNIKLRLEEYYQQKEQNIYFYNPADKKYFTPIKNEISLENILKNNKCVILIDVTNIIVYK